MKLINSFKFAFRGVLSGIKNEMNFRIHTVAAVTVIIFSCIYGVDSAKAALLTLTICLVMVAELINTAVEAMVDIIRGGSRSCHWRCDNCFSYLFGHGKA